MVHTAGTLRNSFGYVLLVITLAFFAPACADQTHSGTSAKDYYEKAFSFAHAGNIEEAVNLYTLAIQKDPEFIDAYYNRGIMHYFLREYKKALEDLNKVIKKKPDHVMAYASRGSVYDKIGDAEGALNDYRKAAQLGDRDTQDYLRSKGIAWQKEPERK